MKTIEYAGLLAAIIFSTPTQRSLILGAVIGFTGQWLRVWSSGYPKKSSQIVFPERWVQQPHILGSLLVSLGVILASGSPWTLGLGIPALSILYRYRIKKTEATKLTKSYDQVSYQMSVPKLVPKLIPFPQTTKSKFSWSQAFFAHRHRELDASLGLMIALVLLIGIAWLRRS